ncbi:hypothetical protein ITP53_03470 [Nonomuraea sp. K274]|uniref:Uncharacterized protein n=1 Tax=Nonomuraea cypriaca TaxID=1187855 RepID=A0A931A256_9ACTN|nr:hypothetical protein [Nonomuraea cypriaca]MBF8184816.1 hypothetical protein [Nonomuraea cypriaca]
MATIIEHLILAIIAAVIVEIVKARARKHYQSLPFLILRLARLTLPRDLRVEFYDEVWAPDLYYQLTASGQRVLVRFARSMRFSLSLLLTARSIALADTGRPTLRARMLGGYQLFPRRLRWMCWQLVAFAVVGTPLMIIVLYFPAEIFDLPTRIVGVVVVPLFVLVQARMVIRTLLRAYELSVQGRSFAFAPARPLNLWPRRRRHTSPPAREKILDSYGFIISKTDEDPPLVSEHLPENV